MASGGGTFGPDRPDGLVLAPFRGLRYDPSSLPAGPAGLAAVTSPPYDVIGEAELAALEQASPLNVVRLILPREPEGGGDRYASAAAVLEQWRRDGVLRPDPEPALYVYEQSSPTHTQRGLLGALALSPPEDGIVLPHENTMAGPVSDRLALYTAVEADLEPIFLLYDGGGAATEAVGRASERAPLLDVALPDGLQHRLWALDDRDQLAAVSADLRPRRAVIADGHHRYATYLQRQAEAHAAGRGRGPWDQGLTYLVDSASFGPEVHPIHRVLPGQPLDGLAERAAAAFSVADLSDQSIEEALGALARSGPRSFLLADGSGRQRLLGGADPARLAEALPADRSPAWRALDVSVLHHLLVEQLWGLTDDVSTVDYQHDVRSALQAAQATGGTAVLLNPTPAEAVAAVAAGGERMPRKSTLFTPKPRSGIVMRDHRDA